MVQDNIKISLASQMASLAREKQKNIAEELSANLEAGYPYVKSAIYKYAAGRNGPPVTKAKLSVLQKIMFGSTDTAEFIKRLEEDGFVIKLFDPDDDPDDCLEPIEYVTWETEEEE